MWSRKRLDIDWGDLLSVAAHSLPSSQREALAAEIQRFWSPAGDSIVCLSVRSAFDLLLTSISFPRGSEILVSAVTIGGMLRIIEAHDLVPVPVDLDALTTSPKVASLARGCSSRTRAIVVAHLFGGRIDLRPMADFARRHDLVLIEDAAQSYAGPVYSGHHSADVSLFSFGPIKTATALGGAIARVRDHQLLARMRRVQASWPVQRRTDFMARVAKYAFLKAVASRIAYRTVVSACRLFRIDHDRLVNGSVRAFADRDFFAHIRQQPSAPLLRLLRRRLTHFNHQRLSHRIGIAEQIMGRRAATPIFPGSACEPHAHWLLPVWSDDPKRLIRRLADAGFDATQGQSLTVVSPPDDRPDLDPAAARKMLAGIVFLPCYPEMAAAAVEQLAQIVSNEPSPPDIDDDASVVEPHVQHEKVQAIA